MKALSKKEKHDLLSHIKKIAMGHDYLKSHISDQEKVLHMLSLLEKSTEELSNLIEKIVD